MRHGSSRTLMHASLIPVPVLRCPSESLNLINPKPYTPNPKPYKTQNPAKAPGKRDLGGTGVAHWAHVWQERGHKPLGPLWPRFCCFLRTLNPLTPKQLNAKPNPRPPPPPAMPSVLCGNKAACIIKTGFWGVIIVYLQKGP